MVIGALLLFYNLAAKFYYIYQFLTSINIKRKFPLLILIIPTLNGNHCMYCVNEFCTLVVAVASFVFAQRADFGIDSIGVPEVGKPQANTH